MSDLSPRVRAVADSRIAFMREYSGLHEYDGLIQDLSASGVQRTLAALGGDTEGDPLDEQVVFFAEEATRVRLGELEMFRRDPSLHLEALDLACYERAYCPLEERLEARRRHLLGWPDAAESAITSLDMVSRDAAAALLPSARGLALSVRESDGHTGVLALSALARLIRHLEELARNGEASAILGDRKLTRLLTCADGIPLKLDQLLARVGNERSRMMDLLGSACDQLGVGPPDGVVVRRLLANRDTFERSLARARGYVLAARRFVAEQKLVPYLEGDCDVAPTPRARRWGVARISWAAPCEQIAPALFHMTPPDESWDFDQQSSWLARFGEVTLPVLTVHETMPGHASHAIAMRHGATGPRRMLWSELFFEGWAHYAEEMCLEQGFRNENVLFQAGVAAEGLVRLARVVCAVGLHTGQLSLTEAVRMFSEQAFLDGASARAEAARGLFEPTYVRYAWGKLLLRDLRERAQERWGHGYSVQRFHRELLKLGSPPLGAVAAAMALGPSPRA